ncbi:hypothetical protein Tco_0253045 [Tanacetum coccineum]
MEAVSSPMVVAAKLPVLNPNEFELWKMRIEQYFQMTDYALWEVIVNGDSPLPKKTVNGVEQTYPPTTAEEKLARKNELKARGTLLMALSNEHQLKFNSYKNVKSLMEAIKKRFGGNKESKKVQKTLLKQHINKAVKTAHGVSVANSKANASTLPNVDSLSDAVIYSFFSSQGNRLKVADGNAKNESKEISQEDMKESSDQEEEEGPTNFALMAYTSLGSSSSSSSDTEVNDRYKIGERYHAVPPPYTGNFMPPKPDLILADKDEYVFSELVTSVPTTITIEVKTSESRPKSVNEPLIKDWVSDSENENETETKSRQKT